MTYIAKPKVSHPKLKVNEIGLTRRDYDGQMSTLCAGCGHDSISSAIAQAYFELGIPPQNVAKTSGIGCSSKTPAYFINGSHGFNSVHGRMPSVTTGASAANRTLNLVGVSGDGDSLSIGFGQFAHAIRRNINMTYIIENNGVYGLTKGQFSASADIGSLAKKGEANQHPPIDPIVTALAIGATFVARSFSGDKKQLVPILKAALLHRGFAILDVISPCVTFNNHDGSTKSYQHTREYVYEAVHADYIPPQSEITANYEPGSVTEVRLHDGSQMLLKKTDKGYDPACPTGAIKYIRDHQDKGQIVTGLLYINEDSKDMHELFGTTMTPLADVAYEKLCPGSQALEEICR